MLGVSFALLQEFEEAIKLKQAAEDTLKTGSEEFEQASYKA